MGDIASDSVSAGGEADRYIFTANAGVFGGTPTVTPSATIDFAELRITNVRATTLAARYRKTQRQRPR